MFEIKLWNVHDKVLNQISRTNNFVEAWHKAFSSTLSAHSLIYKLIHGFQKEQLSTNEKIIKADVGVVGPRKPTYITTDLMLQTIVSNYNKISFNIFYNQICDAIIN